MSRSAWLSMERTFQPISLKAPPNPSQVCAVEASSTVTSALPLVTAVSAPSGLPVGAGRGGDQRRERCPSRRRTAVAGVGRDAGRRCTTSRTTHWQAPAWQSLPRRAGDAAAAAVHRVGRDVEARRPAGRLPGRADRFQGRPLPFVQATPAGATSAERRPGHQRRARVPSRRSAIRRRHVRQRRARRLLRTPATAITSPSGRTIPGAPTGPPTPQAQPLPPLAGAVPPGRCRRSEPSSRTRPSRRCRCRRSRAARAGRSRTARAADDRAAGAARSRAARAGRPRAARAGRSRAARAGRSRAARAGRSRRRPLAAAVPLEPPVPAPLPAGPGRAAGRRLEQEPVEVGGAAEDRRRACERRVIGVSVQDCVAQRRRWPPPRTCPAASPSANRRGTRGWSRPSALTRICTEPTPASLKSTTS